MACINPDGTLTPSATAVLKAAQKPGTAADLAQETSLPLYRIRGSLRELVSAGLLEQDGDTYRLAPAGLARLTAAG